MIAKVRRDGVVELMVMRGAIEAEAARLQSLSLSLLSLDDGPLTCFAYGKPLQQGAHIMKILVCDDDEAIISAYRQVFQKSGPDRSGDTLKALANELFADEPAEAASLPSRIFDVHFAMQGLDAVAMVEAALEQGEPFKVAFIDIRMPPGIDGRETARRIRRLDANINIVIVTAYSDHSVTDIASVAGPADKIFYICKPFSADEVLQMATALSQRWNHDTRQVELLQEKIAELAESEARAQHSANHDFLTGAPNRMAFQRALSERLINGTRNFALALLDLDRFKFVNDTFGHDAGDDLLRTIYTVLRTYSPEGTLIARLGGDEFALLFDTDGADHALPICQDIVKACAGSFSIFGNSVQIGASSGLLMGMNHPDQDADNLLRYADLALFAAKRQGRDQVCIFDAAMDASQKFRRQIELGLDEAISKGELELHYQPIVEREGLDIVGFEGLLRWTSPEHGEISPAVFIPIAEESIIIHRLGDWVIDRALQDCREWPDQYVSINFSPRQFKRETFVEYLCARAGHWQVPHARVQIEVTETTIFDNVERATEILLKLHELGFRIALDDFGTGYSSLFHVKNFALDCIKIDRTFIEGLGTDRYSAAIVSAVTQLARGLGLFVVAEGVETEAQCQALRMIGSSHMQGYLFGKAAPQSETLERLMSDTAATEEHRRQAS